MWITRLGVCSTGSRSRTSMLSFIDHSARAAPGLTEAAGTICNSRLDETLESRTTRLGVPLDEWEVRIVNVETGAECGTGERGEICARGPNMLWGYFNAPEKTAESIRDGWLHTGDIGSFDENGTIMFHGRTKDMLKVGGEKKTWKMAVIK